MNFSAGNATSEAAWRLVLIAVPATGVSLVTVAGNALVLLCFWVNSRLRTVGNSFLLSLACADLVIGAISMNLFTAYAAGGRWVLGPLACDLWLALDYVTSNASVLSLLAICLDRYLSVSRPLTYRAKRTPRRAAAIIGLAWAVSVLLWGPAILCWPWLAGDRAPGRCYVQFLAVPLVASGTAIVAFYLPVVVMCVLYWRVYGWTKERGRAPGLLRGSGMGRRAGGSRGWTGSRCCSWGRRGLGPDHSSGLTQPGPNPGPSSSGERVGPGLEETTSLTSPGLNGKHKGRLQKADDPALRAKGPAAWMRGKPAVKEKKAARTLSAILLALIVTWTPYNIMVLVSAFCQDCVPGLLWQLGYWLCYVNSTINPVCYALCNMEFRRTFKMLLLGHWDRRKWPNTGAPVP